MRIHQFIYVIAELPGGDVTDSGPETKKLQEEELHFVSGFIQDIPLTKKYLRTWMKRSERQLTYLFSTAASLPIINLTQLRHIFIIFYYCPNLCFSITDQATCLVETNMNERSVLCDQSGHLTIKSDL